jgi:hypothetical protein
MFKQISALFLVSTCCLAHAQKTDFDETYQQGRALSFIGSFTEPEIYDKIKEFSRCSALMEALSSLSTLRGNSEQAQLSQEIANGWYVGAMAMAMYWPTSQVPDVDEKNIDEVSQRVSQLNNYAKRILDSEKVRLLAAIEGGVVTIFETLVAECETLAPYQIALTEDIRRSGFLDQN